MKDTELKQILNKLKSGTATAEEKAFIESWYLQYNEDEGAPYTFEERLQDAKDIWAGVQPEKTSTRFRSLWPRIAAAASVLLLLYFGVQHLAHKQKVNQYAKNQQNIIVPGSNKAVLTLANGKQIVLTDAHNGKLAEQGSSAIRKTAKGQLIYTVATGSDQEQQELVYNTITTPMGGQYWIILSDGSKVLLNAGSSLRYPTSFTGKERKVELTGEAYFEVVHNDAIPFRIATEGQVVEDIGTHFNINAYHDEPGIKTTLLEGSVKVSSGSQQVILKPGQQSLINFGSDNQVIKVISNADTEEAVAWKNGLFEFKNSTIQQVMNNTARWYDFKVIYENKIPDLKISGKISRNVNFSGLIDLLKFEGVKFKIEGRIVTIQN